MLKKYFMSIGILISIIVFGVSSSLASYKEETEPLKEPTKEPVAVSSDETKNTKRAARALNSNEIIVYDYSQLSSVLSENNGYTYIYLGADIVQTSSDRGIDISASKSSIIIDGLSPETNKKHTFTQGYSASYDKTILIQTGNKVTKNVVLQNMDIVGQNYYGIVCVVDYSSRTDVQLEYKNIDYVGPQITYNKYGTAVYKDSNITIQKVSGIPANEVAEINHIILSGNVNIERKGEGAVISVFWITNSSGSLTVKENANVNVKTSHYFIYGDNINVLLEDYSKLDYIGEIQGFMYSSQSMDSLKIKKGAYLGVRQVLNDDASGLLRINKTLDMEEGSSLNLDGTGTLSRNVGVNFVKRDGVATFDRPKRVKIHLPSKKPFDFTTSGTLDILTDSVNLWNSSNITNDSINNIPTHIWNKSDNQPLKIVAQMKAANVTSLSSSLDGNDPTTNLTSSTFELNKSELVTFGKFFLQTDKITNSSKMITGKTESSADVEAIYKTGGITMKTAGTAVNEFFAMNVSRDPDVNVDVRVKSYFDNLNKVEDKRVEEYIGFLKLKHVPKILNYGIQEVPNEKQFYMPTNSDGLFVEIEDTRNGVNNWKLTASSTGISSNLGKTENISLVYKHNTDSTEIKNNPVIITQGNGNNLTTWNSRIGVGLEVTPGEIYSEKEYKGIINWSLEDVP